MKKQKKLKKKSKSKVSKKSKKVIKKKKRTYKKKKKRNNTKKSKNTKKKIYNLKIRNIQNDSLIFKLVKLQLSLKPKLNFKVKFSLEKYVQGFFDKISETISKYKILKKDEKRGFKN